MIVKNKTVISFEKLENIATSIENASLGQIYDHACALKAFAENKIKELEEQPKAAAVPAPDIQPQVTEA